MARTFENLLEQAEDARQTAIENGERISRREALRRKILELRDMGMIISERESPMERSNSIACSIH